MRLIYSNIVFRKVPQNLNFEQNEILTPEMDLATHKTLDMMMFTKFIESSIQFIELYRKK